MRKLKTKKDILVLTPTADELKAGAHYAAVSLPWTFNRMMLNTSSAGQRQRALNIAKGIVGQEMLKRAFTRHKIEAQAQRKSYRDEDFFDLRIDIAGASTKLDLKTLHYFTDYPPNGREPFSADLLLKYSGYADADWRTFFPMLVPHTQINQDMEVYCFAIASGIDLRNDIDTNRTAYALTAFPYGKHLPFLSSKKLCLSREDAKKGFYLEFGYESNDLFTSEISLSVTGEWAGKPCRIPVKLQSGAAECVGPFSCITSFQVEKESYDQFCGSVAIAVKKNAFKDEVLNTARRNTNLVPKGRLVLTKEDFCNLFLPTDYTLYIVGWTTKDGFLQACRKYTGWVWPMNIIDKFKNQAWTQITERDRRTVERAGFGSSIQEQPRLLNAGWLKTSGQGNGACCYVYPNIGGARGGVKETNLYILPTDLYTMDSIK